MNLKDRGRTVMRDKAQTMLEYAVLITVVIVALITVGVYFKRSIGGGIHKKGSDLSGEGFGYSYGNTTGESETKTIYNETGNFTSQKVDSNTTINGTTDIEENTTGFNGETNVQEEE
jgi:uncharacterized protein (UPF0333 family)